ncbi:MAG: glucose-1-phosphate thymidylyltransferase [Muribaculaceae bacterium]|nr:glucose-1-phosphate thymidylyltransferase [Muribaculaceae bacterium]
MKNIILFDNDKVRASLLPLTFTRPVACVRFGAMTIAEKWVKATGAKVSFQTQDYLSEKYPALITNDTVYIAGHVCPDAQLIKAIEALSDDEMLVSGDGELLAYKTYDEKNVTYEGNLLSIHSITDVFMLNEAAILADFEVLTVGRESMPLSDSCRLVGDPSRLFIEPGAKLECANINVTKGPVYIGRDAEVMEGACLRGPIAMCEHSVVNMGGKIYGATTLGPYCKVGGELNNVVMTGYSNKAHDGFLGNAVIGEWCNLGAGCTASNLKNTYGQVRLWSYATGRFEKTNLQFCGLIMGDHSKAGINTMFNTATVVGVGVNFYGAGFPRTFIPSFQEGSTAGMKEVDIMRMFDTASRMMARRHVELTEADKEILIAVREFEMKV